MSLITEFRHTEDSIRELEARLASLKANPELQKEIDFESKLKELLGTYGKSLRDVQAILDPQRSAGKPPAAKQGSRAPRVLKRYKNPNNGEVVETKGGNHKTLNAWKKEYGTDTVKSWLE